MEWISHRHKNHSIANTVKSRDGDSLGNQLYTHWDHEKARFSWASLGKGGGQLAFLERYSVKKDDLNG